MKVKLLTICFCLFTTILLSQKTEYLSFKLSLVNSELSNIEPLVYRIELTNNSDSSMEIRKPWTIYSYPKIEFYDDVSNSWIYLEGSGISNSMKFNPMTRMGLQGYGTIKYNTEIKSKEKISKQIECFLMDGDFLSTKYLVNKNKDIRIRAVAYLDYPRTKRKTYSNEEVIKFTDYSTEDSLALNYLKKLTIPHFIYGGIVFEEAWLYNYTYDKTAFNGVQEAKYLIENYPNSKFTSWAYLHLAWSEYAQTEGWEKKEKGQEFAKKQIEKATTLLENALKTKDDVSLYYIKYLYNQLLSFKYLSNCYGHSLEVLLEMEKEQKYIDSL